VLLFTTFRCGFAAGQRDAAPPVGTRVLRPLSRVRTGEAAEELPRARAVEGRAGAKAQEGSRSIAKRQAGAMRPTQRLTFPILWPSFELHQRTAFPVRGDQKVEITANGLVICRTLHIQLPARWSEQGVMLANG
jgi:hypothetical protein